MSAKQREIHYTFVLKVDGEHEEFEGEFEDGLTHVLETVGHIQDAPDFTLDLLQRVVQP
jgi:hypothetical protein